MNVKLNIEKIKSEIPDDATLVAVVKYADKEKIKEAVRSGIIDIGFNTLQQMDEIKKEISAVNFHFIGHLQSNKVRKVLKSGVYLIQSVDSYKLAEKINRACEDLGIKQSVLLQVKTDESKDYGIKFDEIKDTALRIKRNLTNISVIGLMTIPPVENPKKYFAEMKKAYDSLSEIFDFRHLSMGMSNDYKEAIEEGANMIRLGRKIFS